MKTFILYWLDGKQETLTGNSISDAFNRAGYGAGAVRALDYFHEVKDGDHDCNNPKY
jgi:hypothetical protein